MNKLYEYEYLIRKVCLVIIALALIAGVFSAVNNSKNTVHVTMTDSDLTDVHSNGTSTLISTMYISAFDVPFYENVPSVDELMENSDIVIIAEATGEREIVRNGGFMNGAKIIKVIKNNGKIEENGNIFFYDSSSVRIYTDLKGRSGYVAVIQLNSINNILQTGKKYILFLNKYQYPSGYNETSKDKIMYYCEYQNYCIFPYDYEPTYCIKEGNESIVYADVKEYDCIYPSEINAMEISPEEIIQIYSNLRNDVLEAVK